jgi:hypothetical protein
MGGFGSGRYGGQVTVEGCRSLKLDVNRVTRPARDALQRAGEGGEASAGSEWTWTASGETAPWARVVVRLRLTRQGGEARLIFDVPHAARRTGAQHQRVQLVTTPCRFGGQRWWWVCPATGRRCATLYLPNGGTLFLSRGPGAYRLAYDSQREGPMDRAHSRLARVCRRAGGHYSGPCDGPPTKPKWMRWPTYDRLLAEWQAAEDELDAVFIAGAERLLARSARHHRERRSR